MIKDENLKTSLRNNILVALFLLVAIGGALGSNIYHYALEHALKEIGLEQDIIDHIFRSFILMSSGFIIIGTLVSIWIANFFAEFITRPIYKLMNAISHVSQGQLTYQMKIESEDEFGQLNKEFNKMVTRLKITQEERSKIEKFLKESEEKFRSISAAANDAIIMMDENDNISFWNDAAERTFGFNSVEVMGKPLHQIVTPKRYRKMANTQVLKFKETGQGPIVGIRREIEALHKNGTEFPVELSVGSIKIQKRWHAIGVVRDITERKKMEEDLKSERKVAIELSKRAQTATKSKSDFLANMSHEIRTPMNAILGFSDLLGETSLDEQQKKYIDFVQTNGKLLISIINDILDFSKLEIGKTTFEHINFNLRYLVGDVVQMIPLRIEHPLIKIHFNFSDNTPQHLLGDPTKLRQILVNILGNAIKFTSEGEINLTINRVESEVNHEEEPIVQFSIKDTGIGIPEDQLNEIFSAFNQADTTTTRKYGGTGLGLTICKSLVEGMGGNISVKSKINQGSEFTFTIKFKKGNTPAESDIAPFRKKDLKNKSVFVVENDPVSKNLLRYSCTEFDLNLLAISDSPDTALQKMDEFIQEKKYPDIIFYALNLWEHNEPKLPEKIRNNKQCQHIKMIALTSNAQVGEAREAKEKGFDAFLPKPIVPNQLLKILLTVYGDSRKKGPIVTRHLAEELICKGLKILVAEDNIANQELIKSFFEILGCVGDYASNGQEAIEKLLKNTYDLCLMDLQMPIMSGIAATRIIRKELLKNIPILALTAAVLPSDSKECMDAGMNDFINKPVNLNQLKEKILQYTRLKK